MSIVIIDHLFNRHRIDLEEAHGFENAHPKKPGALGVQPCKGRRDRRCCWSGRASLDSLDAGVRSADDDGELSRATSVYVHYRVLRPNTSIDVQPTIGAPDACRQQSRLVQVGHLSCLQTTLQKRTGLVSIQYNTLALTPIVSLSKVYKLISPAIHPTLRPSFLSSSVHFRIGPASSTSA